MAPKIPTNTRKDPHHAHFDGPLINGCFICKTSHNLKTCAGCRLVSYCAPEHQKQDWNSHKAACNRVRKAQQLSESEEQELRISRPNLFAKHAGHFWGIVETRDYMQSLMGLAEAQFNMKTTKAVQAGLDTCLEMHRLCRKDNLSVRQSTPIQMMRLGKDQDAHDFMKWWHRNSQDSQHGWGKLPEPFLDIKDANILETVVQCTNVDRPELPNVAPLALLKTHLLLDLKALDDFTNIMRKRKNPLPQEIQDEIRRLLVGNAISSNKELMDSPEKVHSTISDLEHELKICYELVDKANQHFWPALLNTKQELEVYPPYSEQGTEFEMQVTLRHIYPAFIESPGAIRLVKEWWEKKRGHDASRA